MRYLERSVSVERGALDMDSGEFPMVLATEGEASDGHILSIRGLDVPERMPLLFGHLSDETIPMLGSVVSSSKGRKEGVPVLRAQGRINLNGGDPLAETRRGIAQLVHDGDLSAVSIRWTGEKMTPRSQLPKDHKYFVAPDADSEAARWGMFFEKARALEGSVVAIGADPKAIIGRAEATDDPIARAFFVSMARPSEKSSGDVLRGYTALQAFLEEWRGYGFSDTDLAEALGVRSQEALSIVSIGGHELVVSRDVAAAVEAERGALLEAIQSIRAAEQAEAAGEAAPNVAVEATNDDAAEASPITRNDVRSLSVSDFMDGFRAAVAESVSDAVAKATGRRG